MNEQIISWSHSKYVDFSKCKLSAKLKYIDKIPEPERELPPGKTEHANDRGSRIHDSAEMFIRGKSPLIHELRKFEPEFKHLKHLFEKGKVSLEHEWGMSKDWEIAPYKKAWHRAKLDALVHVSPIEAIVIDYKSGRRFGNELKHAEQLQIYQLDTFLRFPKLEIVHAELWYVDVDELTSVTYTRDQGLRFKRSWNKRGLDITECTSFPANPNKWSCAYCAWGPWFGEDAPCKVGVR